MIINRLFQYILHMVYVADLHYKINLRKDEFPKQLKIIEGKVGIPIINMSHQNPLLKIV